MRRKIKHSTYDLIHTANDSLCKTNSNEIKKSDKLTESESNRYEHEKIKKKYNRSEQKRQYMHHPH